MKKIIFLCVTALSLAMTSCKKQDFADSYADPSKISTTSVEKQYAGFLSANREYVLPAYWNYFVVLRTTVNRYSQAVGWINSTAQYVPGAASINDRWNNYYNFLAQYRELEKIYATMSTSDKALRRIYMITSTIYLYDHTQKVVDLHGDIPFSEAGKLSANGGDYAVSLPKYDKAEDIYTKMLDDLKAFADELNSITITPAILQDGKSIVIRSVCVCLAVYQVWLHFKQEPLQKQQLFLAVRQLILL
jgi:tetratricopeptide (TPR) repeat protein